ncbi:tRNA (N6-threonylcarbamoyladenosine(37)-N6)-methyltransferase TrmO [Gallaecimonas sp. GXIMD4217]|uniref:tRNA (N6-threonylcarbamoyladenosine(37)-N6)-methyltransferase TrmO n=1 Tax=Gallaecimonas sp. GXIMD4217 TaxID=3131927 RepID=UPI00311AE531
MQLQPIGVVQSPFDEKFAVPRQPRLIKHGTAVLRLTGEAGHPDTVRGLEAFSHLWLLFCFHEHLDKGWKPLVRPPRLGGNAKVGVFASRSTFRPNPIGLSLVELKAVHADPKGAWLELGAVDLVDGTPILDIKPYIPYADALPHARAGYASEAPPAPLAVAWSAEARQQLRALKGLAADFPLLVEEVLAQDPRPAYQSDPERVYGVGLCGHNVRFRVAGDQCLVVALERP